MSLLTRMASLPFILTRFTDTGILAAASHALIAVTLIAVPVVGGPATLLQDHAEDRANGARPDLAILTFNSSIACSTRSRLVILSTPAASMRLGSEKGASWRCAWVAAWRTASRQSRLWELLCRECLTALRHGQFRYY